MTPYHVVDGVWEPEIPVRGWCSEPGVDCVLEVDHVRPRKTGPCFPLTVMNCRAHGCAFTLYPPGHVPYGRKAIAPVASDGALVRPALSLSVAPSAEVWRGTIFEGAMDAADEKAWGREVDGGVGVWWGGHDQWRSTQGEHIDVAAALLGIAPWLSAGVRQQIGSALAVPTLSLLDAVVEFGRADGRESQGAAVMSVLGQVSLAGIADRMAVCGHLCGWRGPAHRWDGRQLRALPFRPTGTGPPGGVG